MPPKTKINKQNDVVVVVHFVVVVKVVKTVTQISCHGMEPNFKFLICLLML